MSSNASGAAAEGSALADVEEPGDVGLAALGALVLPRDALRPCWSSAGVLLYAGTFLLLSAAASLISTLVARHDNGALFGLTAVVLGALLVLAGGARLASRDLAAGLLAFVGVVAFAVWVGTFLHWTGSLPEAWQPFAGLQAGILVLTLALVAAALVALSVFRAPLLVLPAGAGAWYVAVDLVGGERAGGRVAASIAAGLLLVAAGVVLDRRSRRAIAFWLHTTGALAVGAAVLWQWSSGHGGWALVALVALLFLATARVLGRSTYAVLAVIGLYASGSHYIGSWYEEASLPHALGLYFGEPMESTGVGGPLLHGLLALALMSLGVVLQATGVRTTSDERGKAPPAP